MLVCDHVHNQKAYQNTQLLYNKIHKDGANSARGLSAIIGLASYPDQPLVIIKYMIKRERKKWTCTAIKPEEKDDKKATSSQCNNINLSHISKVTRLFIVV